MCADQDTSPMMIIDRCMADAWQHHYGGMLSIVLIMQNYLAVLQYLQQENVCPSITVKLTIMHLKLIVSQWTKGSLPLTSKVITPP